MTAPAKTESAIDDDRFSLTSGLTKSVEHLSELETISDSSTRVDMQVIKIADVTLMKRIKENSKWTDDSGKFQKCCVRGRDGSAIFHAGDEAMSAERERIIPKGSDPSEVKIGKEGRKKRKRDEMGSYEQETQFDKDQTSGAGLSSQQTFAHISLLLVDTLQIHQKFVLTWNIRGILELHDATIYLSTMHDYCNGYRT